MQARITAIKIVQRRVRRFLKDAKNEGIRVNYTYFDGWKSYPESFDPADIERIGDGYIVLHGKKISFEELIKKNGIVAW